MEQACAEAKCHCFLARLKKIFSKELLVINDDVPSTKYVISELQGFIGLDVITVPELRVSGEFLPTKRLYPR